MPGFIVNQNQRGMTHFVVMVFTNPETVNKSVVPRARLFAPGFGPGNGNGKSGMFFLKNHIEMAVFT
jgi:hypothetical protein